MFKIAQNQEEIYESLEDTTFLRESVSSNHFIKIGENIKIIFKEIEKRDIQLSLGLIYVYLYNLNLENYFDLACSLVLKGILNDTKDYDDLLSFLLNPQKYALNINIDLLISNFYEYMEAKDFDQAKLCLYLIKNKYDFLTEDEKIEYHYINSFRRKLKDATYANRFYVNKYFKVVETSKQSVLERKPKSAGSVFAESNKNMLDFKLIKLHKHGGVTLFPVTDDFRLGNVISLLEAKKDIRYFTIDTEEGRKLYIKKHTEETMDLERLYTTYNTLKFSRNYEACKNILLKIINGTERPKSQLYSNLAYIFLKLKDLEEALKYYTLANYISWNIDGEYKYDEIIRLIRDAINDPLNKFGINDNIDMVLLTYGISDNIIKEIGYMMNKMHLTIDEAVYYYDYPVNKIVAIKLYFAKKFLLNGKKDSALEILQNINTNEITSSHLYDLYNSLFENRYLYSIEAINRKGNK